MSVKLLGAEADIRDKSNNRARLIKKAWYTKQTHIAARMPGPIQILVLIAFFYS